MAATTWVTTYGSTSAHRNRRAERQPDGDRGVEVAAADVPDGVGHRDHGEAEGEGHAEVADADVGHAGGQDGRAAPAEHQHEGAEELCGQPLVHRVRLHTGHSVGRSTISPHPLRVSAGFVEGAASLPP